MKKEILLKNGNKTILSIDEGYCTNVVTIVKYYLEENCLVKSINLSIWDDMAFSGYTKNLGDNLIEYEFDINDPIYFSLNNLLGEDEKLIIDDDNTGEKSKKYMIILKENHIIKIVFINKVNNYKMYDKFSVFIKNIGPDARSKINDFNLKLRLIDFFRDCELRLKEYQLTLDECIEIPEHKNSAINKQKKLR